MRNLAIIPARSGSKGLPDKNILSLCGKPLLAYSIEAAIESRMFDEVYLSTDSTAYAEIGERYGASIPFLRRQEAASDTASSWDVVREAVTRYEEIGRSFDTCMLLQPTSPLRTAYDIRQAYQIMNEKAAKSVVSVCKMEHSPLWCNTLPEDGCMRDFIPSLNHNQPRQALPIYYRINGAIYLVEITCFLQQGMQYDDDCYAYIMPDGRSIDIDSEEDFTIAMTLLKNNKTIEEKI